MRVELSYADTPYVRIRDVAVIGTFNNFDAEKGKMEKRGEQWIYEIDLEPGEYIYRFIMNGEFQLPDPLNNLYEYGNENELWSLIIIGQDGLRRYNNDQYTVNIEDYVISPVKTERANVLSKKYYNANSEKQVVARFKFNNITGLHLITAVWYQPNNQPFIYSENALYADTPDDDVTMWFWLDISEILQNNNSGIWCLKLFVDGDYILEDLFTIDCSNEVKMSSQLI